MHPTEPTPISVTYTNGNGAAMLPAEYGPRVTRRIQTVDLPEPYSGLTIKLWVNYPSRLNADLTSGDKELQRLTLCKIVLEHNGWRKEDEDGNDAGPYPPANTVEFWDEIPDELATVILTLLLVEIPKLAASLRERSAR